MSHTIGQVKQQQQSNSNFTETINNSSESGDKSSPSLRALTDGDYEFLFNQLLQGIAHGWHQKRVEKFFTQLGDRGKEEDWIGWLERFGSKILTQHLASREQLAILMIRLGEMTQSSPKIKKMGATSYHLGRQLLSQHQNLVSQSILKEKTQTSQTESLVWEYDGPDLADKLELVIEEKNPVSEENLTEKDRDSELIEKSELSIEDKNPTTEHLVEKTDDLSLVDQPELLLEKKNSASEYHLSEKDDDSHQLTEQFELAVEEKDIAAAENLSPQMSTESPTINNIQNDVTSEIDELPSFPAEKTSEDTDISNTTVSSSPESELQNKQPLNHLTSSELMSLIQQDEELAQQISRKLNISLSDEPELSQNAIAKSDNSDNMVSDVSDSSLLELVESWFNLGLKQASAGEFEAAVNSWEQALQLNPNLSEAWHNRGSALGRLGKYEPAIESFEKALAIAPNNYQAWNDRAHALYQLQRWQEAVASWNQAIEIMPNHHLFWYNRACALEQLKLFDDSIASYEKALEIKPNFQPARTRYINLIADNSQTN